MDALFTIIGSAAVLALFSALSLAFGSESREGYTERSFRPSFR